MWALLYGAWNQHVPAPKGSHVPEKVNGWVNLTS